MHQNHFFALFELPIAFEIDKSYLKQKLLELQKQYHPDRVDNQDELLKNQNAALINHAFNTLNKDEERAAYLLSLANVDCSLDESIDDWDFLGQMMELRISLEESEQQDALNDIAKQVSQEFDAYNTLFAQAYQDKNWQTACDFCRKLKFLAKLQEDVLDKITHTLHTRNDDDLYV